MFFPPIRFPPIVLCDQRYVRVRMPDGSSAEIPESEFGVGGAWQETSRQTSVVDIDGTEVERIDRLTMRLPSGGTVTMIFNNPDP
jgi:hypothetical protein